VATVAINGAKNAGILAAQILGTSNNTIAQNVIAFKQTMEQEVLDKSRTLEEIGPDAYLNKPVQ
jgi:5-(carboxyamino)imidazole ribonucleotide mutase